MIYEKKNDQSNISVSVELCVRGDFNPDEITEKTGIIPCKTALKGSRNQSLNLPVYSGWSVASETIQFNFEKLNEITIKLISNFEHVKNDFKCIVKKLNAETALVILFRNYTLEVPLDFGYFIHKDIVKFISDIEASIEVSFSSIVK